MSTVQPMDAAHDEVIETLETLEIDEIARARRAGRSQAEAFDAGLSAVERREREDRLTRIAWLGGGELVDPVGGGGGNKSAQVASLERQLEHFASFHHAVLHSRGWRLLQALRRLVGRAW